VNELLRLLGLFRPWWPWLLGGVLLSLLTVLANVALMAVAGWFIASMALAGIAGVSINYFAPAAIIRACAITRTVGRYAERLLTHSATLRLLSGLRVWFYQQLEPLAPARLHDFRSGDLFSRIRADIDTLDNFYLKLLAPTLVALLASLLFVGFLLQYSIALALLEAGLLLTAGLLLPWLIATLSADAGRQLVETRAQLRITAIDGLQGMGELLVYGAADAHRDRLAALSQQLAAHQQRLSHTAGLAQAGVTLSANLAMFGAAILAIPLVESDALPPAHLAMLALFTLASFEAVLPLPMAFQTLGETIAAARRVFAIIDTEPAVNDPPHPTPLTGDTRLQVSGLHFCYRADATDALSDISFTLAPGRKLAIIGPSGSGKSTLLQLLLRFHNPSQGEISIGGRALQDCSADQVRERFALVSQHSHLFNTSIRNNLLLADPQAADEALQRVCQQADLSDFIASLAEGYDTIVGEAGLKLSGGQSRRLTIARALLKQAPILLLDEPGEGLDPSTERRLMARLLAGLSPDTSLILVTHRLNGLQAMDEILLLSHGKIEQRGSYDALLDRSASFRSLLALRPG
jgi:ATP-binding cassette subfamily C protein CydC